MALPPFIARLRAASRYRQLVVMVGGAALNAEPSLLALLGADATAPDAATALHRAEALVTLLATHA
jgi:methanogenic corrinoid protein MtbC1